MNRFSRRDCERKAPKSCVTRNRKTAQTGQTISGTRSGNSQPSRISRIAAIARMNGASSALPVACRGGSRPSFSPPQARSPHGAPNASAVWNAASAMSRTAAMRAATGGVRAISSPATDPSYRPAPARSRRRVRPRSRIRTAPARPRVSALHPAAAHWHGRSSPYRRSR